MAPPTTTSQHVAGQRRRVHPQHRLGLKRCHHLADGRRGDRGHLGDGVDRHRQPAASGHRGLTQVGVHPVGDHRHHRRPLLRHGAIPRADGRHHLLGATIMAVHHGQHRGPELVGQSQVEPQLAGQSGLHLRVTGLLAEVRADHDHRVTLPGHRPVPLDDQRDEFVGAAVAEVGAGGLVIGAGERLRRQGHRVPLAQQFDDRVGLAAGQRAEGAQPLDPPGQQLGQSEGHRRLSSTGLYPVTYTLRATVTSRGGCPAPRYAAGATPRLSPRG